jgi:2-iminobutanoate/2-iminopropanoate deaminase
MRAAPLLLVWLVACGAPARRTISTDGAPKAIGPYSQAVDDGTFVWCAGQIGLDPASGDLVAGGIEAETERALRNLEAVLAAAGLKLSDVVKTTVYVTDLAEFGKMNAVYARHFPTNPPARATVQVAALPKGARVEIEAVARR